MFTRVANRRNCLIIAAALVVPLLLIIWFLNSQAAPIFSWDHTDEDPIDAISNSATQPLHRDDNKKSSSSSSQQQQQSSSSNNDVRKPILPKSNNQKSLSSSDKILPPTVAPGKSHTFQDHHEHSTTHDRFINPCIDEYFFPDIVKSKFDLPPSNLVPPCMIRPGFTTSAVPNHYNQFANGDGTSLWLSSLPSQQPQNSKNPPTSLGPDVRWKLADRLAMVSFLRLFRNTTADLIMDEKFPLICVFSIIHTHVCDEFEESLVSCINRVGGIGIIEAILPHRCISGSFWRDMKSIPEARKLFEKTDLNNRNKSAAELEAIGRKLPRGQIPTITTHWPEKPARNHDYVPKEKRTFAKFIDHAVRCTPFEKGEVRQRRTKVHPFGFSVPKINIIPSVPRYKVFDFLPMFPARHGGARAWGRVNLAEEQVWFEINAASYYGFTHRRGGSDCQRHTELLAAGVVPYFADLESFGMYSLPFLPRKLLVQVLNDVESIRHVGKVSAANITILSQAKEPYHSETSRQLFMEGINHYGDPEIKMKMIARSRRPIASNQPGDFLAWTGHHTNVLNFFRAGTINTPKFDPQQYYQYADEALKFTQNHLTSSAFVSSVLKLIGFEDLDPFEAKPRSGKYNNKVLLIGRNTFDHIHTSIHNGFNELGINVTMVDETSELVDYFYKDRVDLQSITEATRGHRRASHPATYGGGLTWSGRGWNGPHHGGEEFITTSGPRHPLTVAKRINEHHDHDAVRLRQRILDKEFALVLFCFIYPYEADHRIASTQRQKANHVPLPARRSKRHKTRNIIDAEIYHGGGGNNNNGPQQLSEEERRKQHEEGIYKKGFQEGFDAAEKHHGITRPPTTSAPETTTEAPEPTAAPPTPEPALPPMPPLTNDEASLRHDEVNWYRNILPYWNEVIKAYHEDRGDDPEKDKKRILFFDHNDIVTTNPIRKARMYHTLGEFGHVFARELSDDVCY